MKTVLLELGAKRAWRHCLGVSPKVDGDGKWSYPLAKFEVEVDEATAEGLLSTAAVSPSEGLQAFNAKLKVEPAPVVVPPSKPVRKVVPAETKPYAKRKSEDK